MTEAPKSPSNVHPNYSSETNEMTNDVQRDQSAPPPQQAQTGGVPSSPPTATSTPTEPSIFSFPVTKTPGRSISSLFPIIPIILLICEKCEVTLTLTPVTGFKSVGTGAFLKLSFS